MMMSVKNVKEAYLLPSSRYLGWSCVLRYRVADTRLMIKTLHQGPTQLIMTPPTHKSKIMG